PTMALSGEDCVGDVAFHASPAVTRLGGSADQINLRGNIDGSGWMISLRQEKSPDAESSDETVSPLTWAVCRDGKTLSLAFAAVQRSMNGENASENESLCDGRVNFMPENDLESCGEVLEKNNRERFAFLLGELLVYLDDSARDLERRAICQLVQRGNRQILPF